MDFKELDPMKKLFRFLMPIVIAVVLGPLLAGLIVCLFALSLYFFGYDNGPLAELFSMFWVYIMFAYFEGGPVALVAGLLVSIWMIWRRPGLLVVIVAAIAAIGLCYLADGFGMFNPIGGPLVSNNLGLMLVLSVMGASVCWFLTRRFAPAPSQRRS
jgi:hypothetical protein